MARVLIIEDDRVTADEIGAELQRYGLDTEWVSDGATGLERARGGFYDAITLDRMLPGMDGLTLVTRLREYGVQTPVLMISALSDADERVRGLRAGGDDYLTKPFAFAELLARIEALSRRGTALAESSRLKVADLELDLLARKVTRAGQNIDLTTKEFQLLEFLMRRPGQVVTRTMLLEGVWNLHFDPQTNITDVHMSRLRNAVDKGFSRPLIHTVRGAGYVLKE